MNLFSTVLTHSFLAPIFSSFPRDGQTDPGAPYSLLSCSMTSPVARCQSLSRLVSGGRKHVMSHGDLRLAEPGTYATSGKRDNWLS